MLMVVARIGGNNATLGARRVSFAVASSLSKTYTTSSRRVRRMRWKSAKTWWLALFIVGPLLAAGCSSRNSRGCCGHANAGPAPQQAWPAPPSPQTYAPPPSSPSGATLGNNPAAQAKAAPYGGQKTCPVMGEPLGSMGPPIPVTVGGQTIYVCCRGCATRVQRDPEQYLRKVEAERRGS